jgi:4-hydroxy-3-polyprenylbenzoate decarboxylase
MVELETSYSVESFKKLATHYYDDNELAAPLSSGSFKYAACVIIPCSMSTLAKIAHGVADTLITRVAAVCLKEGRKLVLVPRETPLAAVQLENMVAVAHAGARVLPAMPAFYIKPRNVTELVDYIVGKVLDLLEIEHKLYPRWLGRK